MSKDKQILLSALLGLFFCGNRLISGARPDCRLNPSALELPGDVESEGLINPKLIAFVYCHSGEDDRKGLKGRVQVLVAQAEEAFNSKLRAIMSTKDWLDVVAPDLNDLEDVDENYGSDVSKFNDNVFDLLKIVAELFGQLCPKGCKDKFKCEDCEVWQDSFDCDKCLDLRYAKSCKGDSTCTFCFYESTFLRMFKFVKYLSVAVSKDLKNLLERFDAVNQALNIDFLAKPSRGPNARLEKDKNLDREVFALASMIEKCGKHVCLFLELNNINID